MKKKLLVFHPVIAPYRIDLFNYLSQEYNMKLYMFHHNMIDQTFNYEKLSQAFLFKPTILDQFYKIPFLKIRKHIVTSILEFDPDLILVSECGYASIVTVILKKLLHKHYTIISMIDDSYDMLTNNNQFSKKHEWGEKVLIPLFNNIINVEPNAVSFFQKKYNKGIYFPIIQDETRVRKLYEEALPISAQYIEQFQLKEKKILLFVGRLVQLKNIDFVIRTFNKLNIPNTVLVIVGSGEEEAKLKQVSNNNKNILFVGRLEGKPLYAWYNIAEMFVLASTQEAFGAVTNEALIGGCTCLISQNAGSNCLIKQGKNGYIFNPYNEQEFGEVLIRCAKEVKLRNYPLSLRENKMEHSFAEYFKHLIESL